MNILKLLVLFLSIVVLIVSSLSGMLMNYLLVFLLLSGVIKIVTFVASMFQSKVSWRGGDKGKTSGVWFIQALLRTTAWLVIGFCTYLAVVPIQFSSTEYSEIKVMIWGAVIILCLMEWVPSKNVGKALNICLSLFLLFLAYQLTLIYLPIKTSDSIVLNPPLKGGWYVLQGGNSALINHHHFTGSQKYALDILTPEDGKLPLEGIIDLAQYTTFGSTLYAPLRGVVVSLESSLPDQIIGETDVKHPAGNFIVIRAQNGVLILLAHLQHKSILVAEGDRVMIGQAIAKLGNSGNTSQPHLHIQAMTNDEFMSDKSKPIPMPFNVGDQTPVFYKRNDSFIGL